MFRSPYLLNLAREAPHCMACRADNYGQVTAAHSNLLRHGKGRSLKAADLPAYLCDRCHAAIDQGAHMSREERQHMWNEAFADSMFWLAEAGHLDRLNRSK